MSREIIEIMQYFSVWCSGEPEQSGIENIDVSSIHVHRFGKKSNDVRPPTLLVELKNNFEVMRVINYRGKLPNGITVSTDKTRFQREQLRELEAIVDAHNTVHAENYKFIKYIRGIQEIIDSEVNKTNHSFRNSFRDEQSA